MRRPARRFSPWTEAARCPGWRSAPTATGSRRWRAAGWSGYGTDLPCPSGTPQTTSPAGSDFLVARSPWHHDSDPAFARTGIGVAPTTPELGLRIAPRDLLRGYPEHQLPSWQHYAPPDAPTYFAPDAAAVITHPMGTR